MLMTHYYVQLDADRRVQQCLHVEADLELGPPNLGEEFDGQHTYRQLAAPIESWQGATPTEALYWLDDEPAPRWVETATLAELKAAKNAEIDAARESANRSYFDFAGKRIACEDMSWKDILSTNAEIALTQQMPEEWVGGWKAMDKTPDGGPIYVAIPDVATWVLFIKAMVARGTAHFLRSQGLKNQLAAATSPEQIAAITWAAGPVQP